MDIEVSITGIQSQIGFSLVELMVVVGIVAILAAVAVPQVSSSRKRGYETVVKSDLMNAATAEEAYFTKNQSYKAGALDTGTPPGFNKSIDVSLTSLVGNDTFVLFAAHANCGSNTWTYVSTSGQIMGNSCP
jgi:prepilin-type N-terminal cleavage/methylation domain-containing protein